MAPRAPASGAGQLGFLSASRFDATVCPSPSTGIRFMSLLLLAVYKSSKRAEMYLYVPKADGLSKVPEALLQIFGTPQHVMDLPLKPGRDLAQVPGDKLREEIAGKGFYLQMPPPREDYLLDLYNPDDSKYRDIPS